MIKKYSLLVILSLLGLTACVAESNSPIAQSGNNSDANHTSAASLAYSGKREKALLDRNNGMFFVDALLNGGADDELINLSSNLSARNLNPLQTQKILADTTMRRVVQPSQTISPQARSLDETENCSQGGTLTATGSLNSENIGILLLSMNNCSEDGVTLNGSIEMDITQSGSNGPTAYLLSLDEISMSQSGTTYRALGTQSFERDSDFETTIISNILQTGEDGKQVFSEELKFKNQNVTGKIYLEDHGFIDISSNGPVGIDSLSNNFIFSGEVMLSGASSSKVLLSPKYNHATFDRELKVDLDENGDGIYEFMAIQYQSTSLNNPNGFLENTAPIAVVNIAINLQDDDISLNNLRVNDYIAIKFIATDPEGSSVNYAWTIESAPNGSNIELDGPSTSGYGDETMYVRPDLVGTYSISIKATDEDGFSSIEFVNFIVLENIAPIAVITDDVIEGGGFNHLGHRIRLSSDKSSDRRNSFLKKSWKIESKPFNSNVDISNNNYNTILWFGPDVSGTYVISLMVTDEQDVSSEKAYMTVIVPENHPPVADFHIWRSTNGNTVGSIIEFESRSSDIESTSLLDTTWELISKPEESLFTLPSYSFTSYYMVITPDVPGVYTLRLTVTDQHGASASKVLEISISN